MSGLTSNYSLYKPSDGDGNLNNQNWSDEVNANFDSIDGLIAGALNLIPDSEIYYVHPLGDDANDGKSWSTAKETILGAYDAVSSGGLINIYHGSHVGGEVAQQGIWIIGPNDVNWASPPSGWRQQKAVVFQGIPNATVIQFAKPSALFRGGTTDFPYDTASNLPCIWLSGTNIPITFRDLQAHYVSQGIRMGITSGGDRDVNTSQILFQNCNFNQYNVGVSKSNPKPTVEAGYIFWVWMDHCVLHSYPLADVDSDERAAIMQQGDTINGGLFNVTNCTFAGGGFRYHATGATSWSLKCSDLLMEGNFVDAAPPTVNILAESSVAPGNAYLETVQSADVGPGSQATIKVSEFIPAQCVTVIDSGPPDGPATIMGGYGASWSTATESPAYRRQMGFAPWGLIGAHEGHKRSFAPSAVRFVNLASNTGWGSMIGGATVTTGQLAPDGTTDAVKLTSTGVSGRQPYRANRAVAVGDWFVIGCWMKGNGTGTVSTGDIELGPNPSNNYTLVPGPGMVAVHGISMAVGSYGDGEWVWRWNAAKIATVNTSPSEIVFDCRCDINKDRYYYAPVFLHIPAGTMSDNEVMEMAQHLQTGPYGTGVTAGEITSLNNQKINALGGLKVGGGQAISKVLTASTTWDPGNMAADGNSVGTTLTVTGAAVGDPAFAGLTTLTTEAVLITAHVTATNTVRVDLLNKTGGALDLNSGTLKVTVFQNA